MLRAIDGVFIFSTQKCWIKWVNLFELSVKLKHFVKINWKQCVFGRGKPNLLGPQINLINGLETMYQNRTKISQNLFQLMLRYYVVQRAFIGLFFHR